MAKSKLERKGFNPSLMSRSQSTMNGNQGRTGSTSHGGVLAGLLLTARSACIPVGTFPGVSPPTVSWAFVPQSSIKKMYTGLPTGQSNDDIFSVEVSSSKLILACAS